MNDVVQVDYVIVGAGIVGLSIAVELSRKFPKSSIALLEKQSSFGIETSSRNSEVIHAGIYYKSNSLKSFYCIRGKELLYDFCKAYKIPFNRCGKYIVSCTLEQEDEIKKIKFNALENGVFLEEISQKYLQNKKNLSHFKTALWSPDTGIFDSHKFMKTLESQAKEMGTLFCYKNSFKRLLNRRYNEYIIEAIDEHKHPYKIHCHHFINAGGLSSAKIANSFDPDVKLEIKPCRGRYFALKSKYNNYFEHLIYPLPDPNGGLGVHVTFDLEGRTKLGPDVDWSFSQTHEADDPSLNHFSNDDINKFSEFYEAGKKLIPDLNPDDLSEDYIGVRPKLFIDNEMHDDFYIKLIKDGNCLSYHFLGVESPGLTAALALSAELVQKIKQEL